MILILSKGGIMVWFILAASLIGVAVFAERFIYYHRAQFALTDFLKGIRNCIRRNNHVEAIAICDDAPGPVAKVARTAILRYDRSRSEIHEAIEATAIQEERRLERNLPILWTVAQVTPLMGLIGTVMGMISAFRTIQREEKLITASDLAGGVWEALVSTGMGLAVAVAACVAYNYLLWRKNEMVRDMEFCATELMNVFAEIERERRKDEFDLSEP
ncbi:MAG: MotA/TolQ/ExbB proton channel family protein [Verrucomicrobia bacterium]|nr:MotA/TolQ/ExbB proton channel family protein [Verrucomicrobiota bacterium]